MGNEREKKEGKEKSKTEKVKATGKDISQKEKGKGEKKKREKGEKMITFLGNMHSPTASSSKSSTGILSLSSSLILRYPSAYFSTFTNTTA